MAEATGRSPATVGHIWRVFGLKPRRTGTFKLSNDPDLIEKVRNRVGLHTNLPDRAIVLCVDQGYRSWSIRFRRCSAPTG
jgi:hypothetical protein